MQINTFKHHSLLSCLPVTTEAVCERKSLEQHKLNVVVSWITLCPVVACSRRASSVSALLGEDGDYIIALRWSHSLSCMLLTVNLVLHKEMSLLF